MTTKKTPYKNKRLFTIITALICVVLLSTGIVLFLNKRHSSTITDKPTSSPKRDPVTNVDLSPATETDKTQADQNKEEISKNQTSSNTPQSNPSSNSKKSVSPVITYFGDIGENIEVSSYVSGVFEDGGTCMATFTNGSSSFSKTATGSSNVSNTTCHNIDVAKTEFSPKGTWSLIIKYSSSSSEGTSESKTLEIK